MHFVLKWYKYIFNGVRSKAIVKNATINIFQRRLWANPGIRFVLHLLSQSSPIYVCCHMWTNPPPFKDFLFFSWRQNWSRSQGSSSQIHHLSPPISNWKWLVPSKAEPQACVCPQQWSRWGTKPLGVYLFVCLNSIFIEGLLELLYCPLYLFVMSY